jgi:hypothetical protein
LELGEMAWSSSSKTSLLKSGNPEKVGFITI